MTRLGVVVILASALAGCQGDKAAATETRPALGKERGDCKPNNVCDKGLLCLSNLCVRPPPADCAAVGETLASMELGNYAEPETRAPVVAKYRAACDKAFVTKEQGECIDKATDKWTASQCAPDMFPELKVEGADHCVTIANNIRAQMQKGMTGADPKTQELFDKMVRVVRESCEQDGWPPTFKSCVIAAGQNADAMGKCQNLMPKDMQQKMTERMTKMM